MRLKYFCVQKGPRLLARGPMEGNQLGKSWTWLKATCGYSLPRLHGPYHREEPSLRCPAAHKRGKPG